MLQIFREDIVNHHNNDSTLEAYSKVGIIKINDVIYLYLQYRVYEDNWTKLLPEYSKNEMFLIPNIETLENILKDISNHVADIEWIKESYKDALGY